MGSKKAVFWIIAGAALLLYPFINKYDTWDTVSLICGIICCVVGAAWFFLSEFMRYNSHRIYGVWLVLAGAYCYMHGGIVLAAGLDGLFLICLGIMIWAVK